MVIFVVRLGDKIIEIDIEKSLIFLWSVDLFVCYYLYKCSFRRCESTILCYNK